MGKRIGLVMDLNGCLILDQVPSPGDLIITPYLDFLVAEVWHTDIANYLTIECGSHKFRQQYEVKQ